MPNKPTIYGPDGQPIVQVKELHAPRPHRRIGIDGWIAWSLIDRDGRTVQAGEQHNLFLDQGLDSIAQQTNSLGTNIFNTLLQTCVVGTDSTAPDPTDTALGNEVGSTTTTVSMSAWTRTAPGVYEAVAEYEFDFGEANGNLTEVGIKRNAGDLLVMRELFRDGGGNPITITKTSDYKLRVQYTFTTTQTPVTATVGSFTITGIGLITGQYMWRGGADGAIVHGDRDQRALNAVAYGNANTSGGDGQPFVSETVDSLSYADVNGPGVTTSSTDRADTVTPSTYVPGTYTRSVSATWSTARGNLNTIATIGIVGYAAQTTTRRAGFVFVIDPDDRFTKDNLHTLTIDDILTVSWGRA